MNFSAFSKLEDDSEELAFKKQLILLVSLSCSICGILWFLFYWTVFGFGLTTSLPLIFVIIVGSAMFISHYYLLYKILVHVQIVSITVIPILIQWSIGSFHESGFVAIWSFLSPIGAVIFLTRNQSIIWMISFLILICVSVVYEPHLTQNKIMVSLSTTRIFYIMNICIAFSIIFVTSIWFVTNIQKERKHSDKLLLNILPAEVANELKKNGYSKPKQFDQVTIMFTDFKDFTQVSEKLSPIELVHEIHSCFKTFDEIMEKYNIEKIKTIGDSYMCASGINQTNKSQPRDVVYAGLEIIQFMKDYSIKRKSENKEGFEIRIGIHTGPVVTGIVGINKFAYDMWGDAVNIASRMESSGEAGKINISSNTFELVKDDFESSYRGKIIAKNKGEVDMYFVVEKNEKV